MPDNDVRVLLCLIQGDSAVSQVISIMTYSSLRNSSTTRMDDVSGAQVIDIPNLQVTL
jgi:hypothetical protein